MDSLKDLIERRNKAVHDAREILGRQGLAADDTANADRLLDEASALDAKIIERQKDEGRQAALAALQARIDAPARRIIPPGEPGSGPGRKDKEGEPLLYRLGRHEVELMPGTDAHLRASEDYRKRGAAYLKGDYHGRNGHESLGLSVGDNSKGGYLASMGLLAAMIKFLDNSVFMRQIGNVLPPTTEKSVGAVSFDTDIADADWTAEVPASDISEDDAARFGTRELMPHMLTKLVKSSRKLLRSANMNVEQFFGGRFGYKFSISEEKGFLVGTGAQQPLGVFVASDSGITTSQDVTASAATSYTADDLINLLYDLKEPYQRSATFLFSREAVKRNRKLKTGDGQYIWQPGLAGQPGTILDRPYVMSEYVPSTFTTGLYVAAVGDFSHYWIQDGLGLEIQRLDELFALKNQVGFLGRKETDGMPVLAEAFRRLKLA